MTIQSVARDSPTVGSRFSTGEIAILRPFIPAEVIGVAEAAARSGRSMRTIREWCVLHRIGRLIGGRWAISQVALDMFLAGDRVSLDAYLAGDRRSERVCAYYARRCISAQISCAGSASPEELAIIGMSSGGRDM